MIPHPFKDTLSLNNMRFTRPVRKLLGIRTKPVEMGSTSGVIWVLTPSKKYVVYFSYNEELAGKRIFFTYWIDSLQNGLQAPTRT